MAQLGTCLLLKHEDPGSALSTSAELRGRDQRSPGSTRAFFLGTHTH